MSILPECSIDMLIGSDIYSVTEETQRSPEENLVDVNSIFG